MADNDARLDTILTLPCYKPHKADLSDLARRWTVALNERQANPKLLMPPDLRSLAVAFQTKKNRMEAGVMDDDILYIENELVGDDMKLEPRVVLKSLKTISLINIPPAVPPKASTSTLKPLGIFGSPRTVSRKRSRWMPAGVNCGAMADPGYWAFNTEPSAEKQKRKVGPQVKATAPRKRAKKATNTLAQGKDCEKKGENDKGKSATASRKKSTKVAQASAPIAGTPAQVNAPSATTNAMSSRDAIKTPIAQSSTAVKSRRSTKAPSAKNNAKKDIAHPMVSAPAAASVAPATGTQLMATKKDIPAAQKTSSLPTQMILPPPTPRTPARLAREPAVTLQVTPTRRIAPLTRTPPSLLVRARTPGVSTVLGYPMPIIAASPGKFSPMRGLSKASPLVQKLYEKSKEPVYVVARGSPGSRLVLPTTPTFVSGTISRGKSSPLTTPGSKAKSSIYSAQNISVIIFSTPDKQGNRKEKDDATDVARKLSSPVLQISSPSLAGLFSDAEDSPHRPTTHIQVEVEKLVVPVLPSSQDDKQGAGVVVVGSDEESEDDGGLGDELASGLAAIVDDDDDSDDEDIVEMTLMQGQDVSSNAPIVSATAYDGDESDSDTDSDSGSDDEY